MCINSALLFELSKDLGNVGLVCQTNHDVEFLQFHVDWVVIFHKEYFHFMFQDVWAEIEIYDIFFHNMIMLMAWLSHNSHL